MLRVISSHFLAVLLTRALTSDRATFNKVKFRLFTNIPLIHHCSAGEFLCI